MSAESRESPEKCHAPPNIKGAWMLYIQEGRTPGFSPGDVQLQDQSPRRQVGGVAEKGDRSGRQG